MAGEGRFFAVVGASGAGKDSLIGFARRMLAGEPFAFPRRFITRLPDTAEDHASVSPEEFLRMREDGRFVLDWEAHGLRYGIPRDVEDDMARGRHVIVNLSRGVLDEMRRLYPRSAVFEITASRETLATRLAGRGRETAPDLALRLQRAIPIVADVTIRNDGSLEEAGEAFVRALREGVKHHKTGLTS
jgi:ribose 1,5-bisphosphokinase